LTCCDLPALRAAALSVPQSLAPPLSLGQLLWLPTVSAGVTTAARTDATTGETDERTGAIVASDLGCDPRNIPRSAATVDGV
jgi:hypothetical protein